MNVLILENDPREFSLVQQAMGGKKYSVSQVAPGVEAWEAINSGGVQLFIADRDTTDVNREQLIPRIRGLKLI